MSIGSLIVEFEARTAKFDTDMGRAAKMAEKRAKEIDKAFADAGAKIGTAVSAGAAAAAVAVTALVRNSLNAADGFAKLSQKTGVAVESLSKLQYAAGLSDVDDLGGSLVKLNKSIAEAASGSKQQAEAFNQLGVAFTDAQGNIRPTEDVLNDVADAFAGAEDGAGKTALSMELFGKSGAALIPLLNGGSAGLKQMGDEADRLGVTISTSTAQAAEQFNDNLTRLQAGVGGVGNLLAAELAPELIRLTDLLVDTAKDGDLVAKSAEGIANAFKGTVLGITAASNVLQIFGKALGAGAAQIAAIFAGDFKLAGQIGKEFAADMQADVNDVTTAYKKLFSESDQVVKANQQIDKSAQKAGDATGEQGKKIIQLAKSANTGTKEVEALAKATAEHTRELIAQEAALNDSLRAAQIETDDARAVLALVRQGTSLDEARNRVLEDRLLIQAASLRAAGRDQEASEILLDLERRRIDAQAERLDKQQQAEAELQKQINDIQEGLGIGEIKTTGLGENISRAVADAIINGGLKSADDLVDIIGNALKAKAFEITIEPVLDAFAKQLDSIISAQLAKLPAGATAVAAAAFTQFQAFKGLRPEGSNLSGDAFGGASLLGIEGALIAGLDSITGGSVFGTKWRTKSQELAIEISDGILDATIETVQRKKRALGGSNKRRVLTDEAEALDDTLADLFGPTIEAAMEATRALGLEFGSYTVAVEDSIKGLKGAELDAKIAEIFSTAVDQVIEQAVPIGAALGDLALEGENLAQTLVRVANNTLTVNDALKAFGQAELSFAQIDDLLQGTTLEAVAGFFTRFSTEAENFARLESQVTRVFESLNLEVPQSESALRELVRGLDLTTEAGQEAVRTLANNTDALGRFYDTIEKGTASVEASERSQRLAAERSLQAQRAAEYQDTVSQINAAKNSINRVGGLTSLLSEIGNEMQKATASLPDLLLKFDQYKATDASEATDVYARITELLQMGLIDAVTAVDWAEASATLERERIKTGGFLTDVVQDYERHVQQAESVFFGLVSSITDAAGIVRADLLSPAAAATYAQGPGVDAATRASIEAGAISRIEALLAALPQSAASAEQQLSILQNTLTQFQSLGLGESEQSTAAVEALNAAIADLGASAGDAAQDLEAIARERYNLETQLLQLQGDTVALRAREREQINEANRDIFDRITALQDEQAATEAAARASEEAARASELAARAAEDAARAAEQAQQDLREAQDRAIDDALSALGRSVSAEKAAIQSAADAQISAIQAQASAAEEAAQSQIEAQQRAVDGLRGLLGQLERGLQSATVVTEQATRALQAQAQQTLRNALEASAAGQSIVGFPGLEAAIENASIVTADQFATFDEFLAQQDRSADLIRQLSVQTEGRLTVAEMTLEAIQDNAAQIARGADARIQNIRDQTDRQISALDSLLESSQRQVDAVLGVDTSVKSVGDAVAGVQTAIGELAGSIAAQAAAQAQQAAAVQAQAQATIAQAQAQAASAQATIAQANAQAASAQAAAQAAAQSAAPPASPVLAAVGAAAAPVSASLGPVSSYSALPPASFEQVYSRATGSYYLRPLATGTNYVPRDMPAFLHEGEAVVPKAYNPAAGGSAMNTDMLMRELIAEVRELRASSQSVNQNSKRTLDILERAAPGGGPLEVIMIDEA
jgi:hypothetical protein